MQLRSSWLLLSLLMCVTILEVSAVFNGTAVTQGQFPYLVYIVINQNYPPSYACGGGLLNSRYVVTAGHCSFGIEQFVIVGRINVDGYEQSNVVQVSNVTRPSDFGMDGIFDYDDIAIFELATPVPFVAGYTEYLSVTLTAPPIGTPLILAGFGETRTNGDTSLAHYGTIHVYPGSDCNFSSFNSTVEFCTDDPYIWSCPGDSGSPVVVKLAGSEQYTLVGVDSYAHAGPCGSKEHDSVVSQVAAMTEFIKASTPLEPVTFVNITWAQPDSTTITGSTAQGNTTSQGSSTPTTSQTPSIAGEISETTTPQPNAILNRLNGAQQIQASTMIYVVVLLLAISII
jgi:secreted trypsin-like serine protease